MQMDIADRQIEARKTEVQQERQFKEQQATTKYGRDVQLLKEKAKLEPQESWQQLPDEVHHGSIVKVQQSNTGKKEYKPMPAPPVGKAIDPQEALQNATTLRKEFSNQSKVYIDVRDAYGRVLSSAKDPSAAGDLALIFNFMKILDPGSVVREGEFANAENSGSVPQRIWAKYNKVLQGERLSPEMRADFLNRSKMLYKKQEGSHKQLREEYSRLAKKYAVPSENVLVNYIVPDEELVNTPTELVSPRDAQINALKRRYGLAPVE